MNTAIRKGFKHWLPRFREDAILREQVAQVYQNFVMGIVGYYITAATMTFIILANQTSKTIWYWQLANTVVCGGVLLRYFLKVYKKEHVIAESPRQEAKVQVVSLLLVGLTWATLSLFFFDPNNLIVALVVISSAGGITAGGLPMQSPVLPSYYAFGIPIWSALFIATLMVGNATFIVFSLGIIVYGVAMLLFAHNIERVFTQSIQMRSENLDLVQRLQASVDEIKQANEAKSVFLASASHDLRQPLHAMGLFIETLNNLGLNVQQQRVVEQIEASADASRDMLNTLLDFSKLDAGVVTAQPSPFLVRNLFEKLEQELAVSANAKDLIYRTRETNAAANADASLVELVLRNLIINAIRYTNDGGVLVACRKKANGNLSLEVWDTGIGIPKDEHETIFREFHQLGNPERDRQKGFGLGLAIARGLANTMGHLLTVSSIKGKGSVFRLDVPQSTTAIIQTNTPDQEQAKFHNTNIVVVDDDDNIRQAMHSLLTQWGCTVFTYESAEHAKANLGSKSVHLLIVDYRLREGKTGGQALEQLRAHLNAKTPAIIITGDTAPERLREARSYEALLLHKPLATSELHYAIKTCLFESTAETRAEANTETNTVKEAPHQAGVEETAVLKHGVVRK